MAAVLSSVVVVGAGLAAAYAVTALRDQGFSGHVTVLGAEGVEPYDRPPLSKELLSRTEPAWLRGDADVRRADEVHLSRPATGLLVPAAGPVTVQTDDGDVRADAVVLATGARAVRVRGWEHALTLHTAADARALRAALRAASGGPAAPGSTRAAGGGRLVVVGAGWIGGEVAGVAAGAGLDVTVVEAGPAPLASALGPRVGGLTAPWYAAVGVRLLTGVAVERIEPDGVTLADGRVLPSDVVLAAVGARPATQWLADALPLLPDGSIAVDEGHRLLTPDGADPRVLAVGDVARRRSLRHGWVPGGHWDGAVRGPAVAVAALLGGPPTALADPAPYVFSTQLGHELGLHGMPSPADDVVLRGDPADGRPFTALWFAPGSGRLTAVLAVDQPKDVAAGRRLFAGPYLPELDRDRAGDPQTSLRDATV